MNDKALLVMEEYPYNSLCVYREECRSSEQNSCVVYTFQQLIANLESDTHSSSAESIFVCSFGV